jgi:hypothetical protein
MNESRMQRRRTRQNCAHTRKRNDNDSIRVTTAVLNTYRTFVLHFWYSGAEGSHAKGEKGERRGETGTNIIEGTSAYESHFILEGGREMKRCE